MVDGNLTDLILAVNNNLGPDQGGFSIPDPLGEIYPQGGCFYVNGYDLRHSYVFIDFKDEMGEVTPNDVTLYVGWDMEGNVGDVDGDGDPSTFNPVGPGAACGAFSDGAGISDAESYNVLLNLDCTGAIDDIRIQIKNNLVRKVVGGVATLIPGATFAFVGDKLELCVPNYQDLISGLAITTDLCNARIILLANAEFDFLAEDLSDAVQLQVAPSILVEKNPPVQDICAGEPVTWTITVTNDGLCRLDDITVEDILGAGMTYESSNTLPTSVVGQTIRWVYTNIDLLPGQTINLTLTADTASPCATPILTNGVSVEGAHFDPCLGPGAPPATTNSNDSATINCRDLPLCDIDGPSTVAVGGTVAVMTALNPADYGLSWSAISDPAGICQIVGMTTGVATINVMFTGAGACTVTLTVTDPVNPEICVSSCTHIITATDRGGFACPHTIGFWRQQCAQRGNGSTKVCRDGMDNLWRCVITQTGVIRWLKNDGGYETTASLAALSDATRFDRLCSQLQGPRPMTLSNMIEVQYLGLMLNVCSGALPLDIEISNIFTGTVAEAIEAIENAINTGVDIGYWKDVADNINNRIGVLAADCPEGDDLFRNLPGCEVDIPSSLGLPGFGDLETVATRPFPNPVTSNATSIEYVIPSRLGSAAVRITIFDVSGRAVRTIAPASQSAGQHSVDWDLRDDDGTSVTSGIYFYRLTVGDESITEKLMVVRK
ncbi:MAG: FlgD immunoglobulin-like domain containing protein [Candidatus Eisenbacteria bacterium]|nr:FlgD immunoglobulin-like domain containing protein [Candidatus Eisenbacteria bacterium]